MYLLTLLGSLVFYVFYQEWFSWLLLIGAVALPWFSLVLSLPAMLTVKANLRCPQQTTMGMPTRTALQLNCKFPTPPVGCKLRLINNLTGVGYIGQPGEKLPTEHCGKLYVQLHKPGVFDFLGLFRLKIRKTKQQTVLILPEPVELEIPPNLQKHLEPQWRRKPGGGFGENHEIRQYQPGDNLNQIHWKLSAKVGELMLREPMVPERGLMLLTMDLNGTAAELDRKLGQLLWLSQWLVEREILFEIRVLTAKGIESWTIESKEAVDRCIVALLGTPLVQDGSIRDVFFKAAWRHHIGGEQHEA